MNSVIEGCRKCELFGLPALIVDTMQVLERDHSESFQGGEFQSASAAPHARREGQDLRGHADAGWIHGHRPGGEGPAVEGAAQASCAAANSRRMALPI